MCLLPAGAMATMGTGSCWSPCSSGCWISRPWRSGWGKISRRRSWKKNGHRTWRLHGPRWSGWVQHIVAMVFERVLKNSKPILNPNLDGSNASFSSMFWEAVWPRRKPKWNWLPQLKPLRWKCASWSCAWPTRRWNLPWAEAKKKIQPGLGLVVCRCSPLISALGKLSCKFIIWLISPTGRLAGVCCWGPVCWQNQVTPRCHGRLEGYGTTSTSACSARYGYGSRLDTQQLTGLSESIPSIDENQEAHAPFWSNQRQSPIFRWSYPTWWPRFNPCQQRRVTSTFHSSSGRAGSAEAQHC